MKKTSNKFLWSIVLMLGLTVASCSSDDDFTPEPEPIPDPTEELDTDLSGTLEEDLELDASQTYTLSGIFSVAEGATLTIPAGTKIVANTSSEATKTFIQVNQGAKININGTAGAPVVMSSEGGEPGSWGGLVIAGRAETTAGAGANAEVEQIPYGGSDPADNSGSISHLIISDAGAQINPDSEFNGLSLYAVGSGTSIDNVAILNGSDDGVEFFGGSVSATNLYLENNEDDAVDWTEGWNGGITNVYVLHTIENFSTAIEADGDNANPMIENFTAVSTTGNTALQFKKHSGATITGLSLTGYETAIELTEDGRTDLSGIQIEGEDADLDATYQTEATVDVETFAWVTEREEVEPVNIDLSGSLEEDLELNPNNTYTLSGIYSIADGVTLTIPAGTEILANTSSEATKTFIQVNRGAKININGTADAPVVMSSEAGEPGSWGGIVIAGKAETSAGVDANAEVEQIPYGGTDPADNSGSISYLIISDAGAQINSESEFNGLSLYAVGSETTIDNVAILNGSDDGVEFFGGSVSATNLYLENNEDDAVDWTEGWNGGVENVYVYHTIENFSTAIEADGPNGNPMIENFTAVSTTGGTALQFKKQSGATITGLSLTGYETAIEITESGRTDLSGIQIEGEDADIDASYDAEASVDVEDFAWVK